VTGLGLHGSLMFRQRLDVPGGGLVATAGARMALSDPLFLGVDASMGLTGGVAGTGGRIHSRLFLLRKRSALLRRVVEASLGQQKKGNNQ